MFFIAVLSVITYLIWQVGSVFKRHTTTGVSPIQAQERMLISRLACIGIALASDEHLICIEFVSRV